MALVTRIFSEERSSRRATSCQRLYRIPITCGLDGQAPEVTDEDVAAGRGRIQHPGCSTGASVRRLS